MTEVPAFPGVPEMIRSLHADGHTLYILSSNAKSNIQIFLDNHGLTEYFADIVTVYYGSVFYKIYGLHKLFHRHGLRRQDCYYVGNEILDMRAAARAGVRPIAVTWSGNERGQLPESAIYTADTPEDIVKLARGA